MTNDTYEHGFEAAKAELIELSNQRAAIDRRISRLKLYLSAAEGVMDKPAGSIQTAFAAEGLKENCLDILRAAYKSLTPAEVVYELREYGVDIDRYSNPVAVVTTTLKRLLDSGEVVEEELLPSGKKAYRTKEGFTEDLRKMFEPGGPTTKRIPQRKK
jgi:hypothetical protein